MEGGRKEGSKSKGGQREKEGTKLKWNTQWVNSWNAWKRESVEERSGDLFILPGCKSKKRKRWKKNVWDGNEKE
jgi:hypothetical protein